jgi:hypothetical protein
MITKPTIPRISTSNDIFWNEDKGMYECMNHPKKYSLSFVQQFFNFIEKKIYKFFEDNK